MSESRFDLSKLDPAELASIRSDITRELAKAASDQADLMYDSHSSSHSKNGAPVMTETRSVEPL